MARQISEQRRKLVVIAAAVACMGGILVLLQHHRGLRVAVMALMIAGLVYVIVQFGRLRQAEHR